MDMIEKVARAIATANERNGGQPYEAFAANKHSREFLFDQARAAIEAMREPTELMARAGRVKIDGDPIDVWPLMIDAALGGGDA